MADLVPITLPTRGTTHPVHGARHPLVHLFRADDVPHVFLADASRVYEISNGSYVRLEDAIAETADTALVERLRASGIELLGTANEKPAEGGRIHALSLAVAQKCNLGCTYCYAQGGEFGGPATNMSLDVAHAAVDRLLENAQPGDQFTLAFLGGEPLINRPVVQAATQYAADQAKKKQARVSFSITSNGTLLTEEDAEFFETHRFGVTISLDGIGDSHDRQRPMRGGAGSYQRIIERSQPLLNRQKEMQVSARVTVTPRNLRLRETLDGLLELGFHSVGFSPMLSSPTGRDSMDRESLDSLLEQMIDCGREFERRVIAGDRYAFSNVATAMREIHRGSHRPYPCGAGAGYFGVSADGELAACHRFVNEPAGAMGNLVEGIDDAAQTHWLSQRHVHHQEPCSKCWARYLCGGGCHHEVIHRGRPACDYIRGWLHYCLQAYVRLLAARPDYFAA